MNYAFEHETVEVCPHCGCVNVFCGLNVQTQGYTAKCWNCGKHIMICDECLHAEDNQGKKCDWHERIVKGKSLVGGCFRGST